MLFVIGLNAQEKQEKYVFSEKAKVAFENVATPESTLKWMEIKKTERVPKDLFLTKSKEIFDLNEKSTFKEIKVNQTGNDWQHYRLQQMYEGIPIEGAHYLLHEKNGLIETANGHVVAGINVNTTPSISEEIALQMLLNEIGANKYAWEGNQNENSFPTGELAIVSTTGDLNAEDFVLGYKFKIKSINPLSHAEYIVDAFTGSLLHKNSLLCQYDVQGTCQTHRYGTQSITMDYDNNDYRLTESGRNIETYNGNGDDLDDLGVLYFNNPTNNWTNPNHTSGCEAHWIVEQTYDYFLDKHNWQGHDGSGSKMMTWVNVGDNWKNAKGGGGEIYLGEGDGINYGPFTAIDIVAHEYTHSIIQSTANLQYSRESGALNESFADIFGTVIEFEAEPNASDKDWLLGEDISLTGNWARDMSDPSLKGHPATYKDDNWGEVSSNCNILNDNCYVHSNSGVQNHWFYILANGKSGTNYYGYNYNVTGIGMNKAAQVALENLKNYLGPFSGYLDARNGAIQAANALGFTANEINRVEEAWCAVGLGDCTITSTGTIAVISPNGGESLNQGIAKNITWTTSGSTGAEVKIEYSINAGNEWHSITEATSNDGVYQWFPPDISTNLALVRVSSLNDETIFDSSDDYFTINSCGVKASFDVSDRSPCLNETVTFTSTSTGANTYKWYVNGILSYNGPIFNNVFVQAGTYTVELRANVGSDCGDVKTFNVFVLPAANADFNINSVSETISFNAPFNVPYFPDYDWTTGDGFGLSGSNVVKTYDSAGTYTVCLTVNTICGSDSQCKTIQANVLGCTDASACNYDSGANINDGTCIYGNCNNCLITDSLALVALYNSTGGPNWNNTWDLSQPVNTWWGITILGCHVTKIYLYNNDLTGSIPAEIGNLQHLENLNLARNSLTGLIPSEIGNLQHLTNIYMPWNNLTGSIPTEIGNLLNLKRLELHSNGLTGFIPSEIGNLLNLTDLRLDLNSLTGPIPAEIGNLLNLNRLNLSENSLTEIPTEIGNLQHLYNLNIYNCNLTGSIPLGIGNLQTLQTLHLNGNNLTGPIPSEIGNLQHLHTISMSYNNLTGPIPPEIGNLQTPFYIYLNNNNLTGSIPKQIGNLETLSKLSLGNNNLTGSIPSEIGNLRNLNNLSLNNNDLTGFIPSEIYDFQYLSTLKLSSNNLIGSIPSEIGSLVNLNVLELDSNNLTGCYPASLCNLTFLDFSNSNYNYFDCTENLGLPDNGSDQGFQDFCDGITPCSITEVYPGDLNFDGIANYKDIVTFGLHYGEFGISRGGAYQDVNWSGHPSDDWGATQENGSELKHTDADGNGVVDLNDAAAIQINYGNTHTASSITPSTNFNSNSPIEVSLQLNSEPSFVGNDDQLVLDIMVEDVYGSEVALYGGYFTIDYNDPDFVIDDIQVVLNQSWLGDPNQNVEYIIHNDDANKKINVGVTKVDHQNSIGEGAIGRLIATVNNDTPWDTITLDFAVSDIAMQNAEAYALPVGTNSTMTSFQVVQQECVPLLNVTSSTPLQFNHIAQGLIQTTGNINIDTNQTVNFRSDRLRVEDGFVVDDGAKFTFYNEPCGTGNRGVNTSVNTEGEFRFTKNLKSYNYQIDQENFICNFELIESDEISIEILDNNGETTRHNFGVKQSGQNQIILPNKKLPKGEFMVCLKVGFDRYYSHTFP